MDNLEILIRLRPINKLFDFILDEVQVHSIWNAYKDMATEGSFWQKNVDRPVLIHDAPAGAKMHHWWRGGLFEHLREMFDFAEVCYKYTAETQSLNFTLSDIAIGILVHDLSKGIAFQWVEQKKNKPLQYLFEYRPGFFSNMGYDYKTSMLLSHYGIKLTEQQYIALIHTEGGWADASQNGRKDGNMLSKFMHIVDMHSSQMFGGHYMPVGIGEQVSQETVEAA